MNVVHVFRWDEAQAIRLPDGIRLDCDCVEVIRRGDEIVLRPVSRALGRAAEYLASLNDPVVARE